MPEEKLGGCGKEVIDMTLEKICSIEVGWGSLVQTYNKAIRDKIPEIIRASGKDCDVKTLSDEDFLIEMEKKLLEEVHEYGESGSIMELADVLEVVYSIASLRRVDKEKLETLRVDKLKERGGFQKNLFLIQTM